MDEKYLEVISEFDDEERRLLKTYVKEIFKYKDSHEMRDDLKESMKDLSKKIKAIETKAIKNIEERKKHPRCSFCNKKSTEVDKVFKKTDWLFICSECVDLAYEELHKN